jgi:hypothetical protein
MLEKPVLVIDILNQRMDLMLQPGGINGTLAVA